ncbi:flagellar basal body-associated FliL family protein [Geothrix sp. PMB-07]|uniref:flagellar basal body-associated FliL family protein n=1 Tax=Geothrix sp. PMB-07 TaxID=3068640 RepID=UPI002741A629|nr:flagellar basal body-associated FliL family protein [Geothrix sp. PMB-07]WLT30236.1 flagellar basal body-associated FliL family protein [Geothrix sp. PMB-07]
MSDEAGPKKSPMKLIIIIVAALVVLGGGGAGAMMLMKKKAAAKTAEEEKTKVAEAKPHEEAASETPAHGGEDSEDCEDTGEKHESGGHGGPEAAPVMVLTRTVNLTGPRRNAFLRCELNILFCDNELGKLVSGDKPSPEKSLIQSIVLGTLSGKSVEEATDAESREALRKEMRDKLNEQFKPHPPKAGEKEDPKHKKPKKPIKSVLIVDWAIQQ